MDQELLSKKELLDLTGISYGQLYRWKRKNLIPEEWFIRKSTFTGQETFFPKERMLERIEQIKNMKDGLSLDALAAMFSPNPADVSLHPDELRKQNIVTNVALDAYLASHAGVSTLSFEQLLHIYLVDIALKTGDVNLQEGQMMVRTMEEHHKRFEHQNCTLRVVRKLGVSVCILHSNPGDVYSDAGAKTVFEADVAKCIEELKLELS